jgi:hypothetical protein
MYHGSAKSVVHLTQIMGLINAIRTSNPTEDMAAAFVVPLIIQQILVHLPPVREKLWRCIFGPQRRIDVVYCRDIVHRSTSSYDGTSIASDDHALNIYLIQAIHLYVHRHCKLEQSHNAALNSTMIVTPKCEHRNRERKNRITYGCRMSRDFTHHRSFSKQDRQVCNTRIPTQVGTVTPW